VIFNSVGILLKLPTSKVHPFLSHTPISWHKKAYEVMIMLHGHDVHFFHKHPLHLHPDWSLLGVLALSAAIIGGIGFLQLSMPFLALPTIF